MYPKVSIVVATYNRADILEKSLKSMLEQEYPNDYEVIVVNDGSTDRTEEILRDMSREYRNLRVYHQKNSGPNVAKNRGMRKARYDIIVIMDDDCIPEKRWLKMLVSGFEKNVGGVSSFTPHGGTSTAFRRDVLKRVGLFDLRFNEFNLRDDSDLVFRIEDAGYRFKFLGYKGFLHLHRTPKKMVKKIIYGLKRIWKHQADVLLFKKHPERATKLLDVRFGFLRNPLQDFRIATGLWQGRLELSSPQGVSLIKRRSFFHEILIIFFGLLYVLLVKLVRLYGSFRFRKFLI